VRASRSADRDIDLGGETPAAPQRRIEHVGAVGGSTIKTYYWARCRSSTCRNWLTTLIRVDVQCHPAGDGQKGVDLVDEMMAARLARAFAKILSRASRFRRVHLVNSAGVIALKLHLPRWRGCGDGGLRFRAGL